MREGPLLWTFLCAIFLSQVFLAPGVAVSDVLIGAGAAWVAVTAFRLRERPEWPRWARALAYFWAWAVFGGFLHFLRTPFGFSEFEFAKSLTKLTFYGLSAVLVAWALRSVRPERLREALLTLLALHGALAILIYLLMLLWPELPYDRFLPGSPIGSYYFELRWFGDRSAASLVRQVFLRARGLSREPSHLGFVQAMGLGFVLLGGRSLPRFDTRLVLVLASILLTFSLTAYGLLGAVLLLAAPRLFGGSTSTRRAWSLLGVAVALGGVLLLPPVSRTLDRAVVLRIALLLQGRGDSSARLRLLESWTMALRMARESPMLGAGLGNFEQGLFAVMRDMPEHELLGPETQGWNVLAHVLAVTGGVGLVLFLFFLSHLWPGRGAVAALFLLGCIVQGSFLSAPFWVYWVVALRSGDEPSPAVPSEPASRGA